MSLSRAQGTEALGASKGNHRQILKPQGGESAMGSSKGFSGAQVLTKNTNYWGPS